ncbi:MAG: hypothetical protein PWQ99_689 [Clostridia bacterium]|jgi:hypothetical protein|nr:hypothetical protein [Clostridia bacterium]
MTRAELQKLWEARIAEYRDAMLPAEGPRYHAAAWSKSFFYSFTKEYPTGKPRQGARYDLRWKVALNLSLGLVPHSEPHHLRSQLLMKERFPSGNSYQNPERKG